MLGRFLVIYSHTLVKREWRSVERGMKSEKALFQISALRLRLVPMLCVGTVHTGRSAPIHRWVLLPRNFFAAAERPNIVGSNAEHWNQKKPGVPCGQNLAA